MSNKNDIVHREREREPYMNDMNYKQKLAPNGGKSQ